ncbi:MAG TPA: glycosyl hydrolase family 28-related protein [Bryobacteraceae bacterium]|nr:glycosyl hydrolase family 28-related protein [Bryobacteraceae bacterium]
MRIPGFALLIFLVAPACAQSIYTERPPDPLAVIAERSAGLHGDGVADDTAAMQAAIDRVADTTGQGLVFLPSGRYRITHTVYLWSGIRLIGYGRQRPVILLAPNTPDYQSGHGFLGTGRYMLQFASRKPAAGQEIVDANEFTFYSGISNVDFEVGNGNPAAICIRFHVAQHSFLSHMHFSVGEGRAALEDVGNQADSLEIEGGDYGIISVRTSPAWQFLLMDSRLSGERIAAIHTQEVGMTLIRDRIEHAPVAVEIPPDMPEQLYGRDLLLRDVAVGVVLGDTTSQHHEVTLEDIRCSHVGRLLRATHTNVEGFSPIAGPSNWFLEERLTVGQDIDANGREGPIALHHRERKLSRDPEPVASDIPALPDVSQWTSVRELGATGDGGTDDTEALQHAIDSHRVLYFPTGLYRVRGTLHLKPDSILIGLSPATTLLVVNDDDANFSGSGDPVPVIESSAGGHEILTGIGVYSGYSARRAAGVVWHSGASSFIQDVNFAAGIRPSPKIGPKYPRPDFRIKRPDTRASQYPSLWIQGGGGIFRDIWTADTTAVVGLRVENTDVPSIAYQISCEHHMHNEVEFRHASNWTVYALQTEEEKPNGADATPIKLTDSSNITFANLFDYRVSRNVVPHLAAVEATRAENIRFANMHNFSMTRLAFDNSVLDTSRNVAVRTHDFTSFLLNDSVRPGPSLPLPAVFEPHALLQRLTKAGAFSNVAGLTVQDGQFFFTDAATHRILRWNDANNSAEVLSESVDSPVTLGGAGNGELLAIDSSKSVYAISTRDGSAQKLTGEDPRPDTTLLLPTGFHNDVRSLEWIVEHKGFVYAPRSNMAITGVAENEPRSFFYAPGTNTAIMAGGSWKGLLQAVQLGAFRVGTSHYAVSEEDDKVYRLTLDSLNQLSAVPVLARSGTSAVTDTAGNVYVAGAQLFVYSSAGKPLGTVEIPERPGSLAFGGADHRTLFIGARTSLFAIRTRTRGAD